MKSDVRRKIQWKRHNLERYRKISGKLGTRWAYPGGREQRRNLDVTEAEVKEAKDT